MQRYAEIAFTSYGRDSAPSGLNYCRHIQGMTLLTAIEFMSMEQLLADLLPETSSQEEAALLQLHARLQAIYASQSELHTSRDRLRALRLQTSK